MDSSSEFFILLTVIIGALSVLFTLYNRYNYWTRNGVISHIKSIPFLGNTYLIVFRMKTFTDFLKSVYDRYPEARYTAIMDFNIPIIVVRDPELIKDLCVKNFDYFPEHKIIINENVDPIFGKNLFSLGGHRWKEMRTTLSPSFTTKKMKYMFELLSDCASDFVKYYMENYPEDSISVEMMDACSRYASDVIATAAFGLNVNSVLERDNEFYKRGRDATNFASYRAFFKIFMFRFAPKIMRLLKETFLSRSTDRFFRSVLNDTLQRREEENIIRPDMIQLLLEVRKTERGSYLSDEDILAQAFVFFLAGLSTSSTLMFFMAHELAMNPEIQERLIKEVDSLVEKSEDDKQGISYESVAQMKYLDMVISETLRKYPPIAILDRLCVKSFTLPKATPESKEYTIRAKSILWLPVYALHHDPKYFPDPEKFDPERFSDENKNKIDPHVYIPFGVGPRKCIGNRFALMETKIFFVQILRNFILERNDKSVHPIEFERGFALSPKSDEVWVNFRKRK